MAHEALNRRSIRQAARLLGRAPATVSDAVARLERSLSVSLAMRRGGAFTPTPDSREVMRGLGRMLPALDQIAMLALPEADATMRQRFLAGTPLRLQTIIRFNQVLRTGSIRRAARQQRIGQPQLSRQIAALEATLGQSLLSRAAEGSRPTAAGRQAHAAFTVIEEEWTRLAAPSQARFLRALRTIRLGSVIPFGHASWLASAIADLIAGWDVRQHRRHLYAASMTAEELRDGLRSGRIEVAIVDTDFGLDGLRSLPLTESDLVYVVPASHAGSDPAALIDTLPFCIPSRRSGLREAMMAARLADGRPLPDAVTRLVETDSIPVIVNLVARHGFVSLLPHNAAAAIGDAVAIIRDPTLPRIRFRLVWQDSDGLEPLVAVMARQLRRSIQER